MTRVLVVANETVEADELLAELRRIEDERSSTFFVVAPAVAAEHNLGDSWNQAGAIDAAQGRLDRTLGVLRSEGLECDGEVGDMVPFAAVRDALDRFDAELIVISTHPGPRSRWLRKDLVEHVRKAFDLPVVHIVSHVHEKPAV
jgi:GABA permease